MGQRLACDPDLGRLGVCLMEIGQRLIVGAYLHAGVDSTGYDDGTTEGRNVYAVNLVTPAFLDDSVDAFRAGAPSI